MGKAWEKDGRSQAKPTFCPGSGYEGWAKYGRKMVEARQSPPFAQATATGMQDEQKMAKVQQSM